MANLIYNSYKVEMQTGGIIALITDDIRMMLVTSAYTPAVGHSKRSDITNEVTGTGYTAGGELLANKSVGLTGNESRFDADPVVWAASSITARGAVLYKDRGAAASADELIAYFDFGADFTSVAADFTVNPNADGLIGLDEAV